MSRDSHARAWFHGPFPTSRASRALLARVERVVSGGCQ